MAVTLDVIQTGSASVTIHAATGDTVTIEANTTVASEILAFALEGLKPLGNELGVTFAINTSGGAS